MMQANEVDLCVMGRPPKDFPSRAEPFAMPPHVLVTSPTHSFTQAESVPALAVANEPFIVHEPSSGTRTALQEYLDEHHIQPTFLMEMPINEAIKQAVMEGLGVEDLPLMRRWNIVNLSARQLAPAAEAIRYFVHEHGESHLAAMFNRPMA